MPSQTTLVRARFRPHPRGFGFLTPVEADTVTEATVPLAREDGTTTDVDRIFVPPPVARRLVADDLVDAEVAMDDKGASTEAVTVVQRPRTMLVGTVQHGPTGFGVELDPSIGSGSAGLTDALVEELRLARGRQVVVLAGQDEDGAPVGRALVAGPHVVGSPDAARARSVVVALGRAAPALVPGGPAAAGLDPVETATTHSRWIGTLAGGRRGAATGLDADGPVPGAHLEPTDRRDQPCVTIDAASTRDVDDAVATSWDGDDGSPVHVAVHIADVAAYVGIDSPADRYARTVASTTYLTVGANAPMLDPMLSEQALSLLPGEDRWALSVRFAVTPDGRVQDVAVEHALIRSLAKLTYSSVEDWLAGDATELFEHAGSHTDAAEDILVGVAEAAYRLGVERDARVTLEELFDDAELEPAMVDGKLGAVPAEPHANAYRLVERLMVAANEAVARWLVERDVPSLYRAHVGLDPERAENLRAAAELAGAALPALDDPEAEADQVLGQLVAEVDRLGAEGRHEDRDLLVAVATGSTARATYDPDPSHHRGLASAAYTHFTSPIRRYADLVVHRQVRATLAGEPPPYASEQLAPLARWLDARAGAVSFASSRERSELWAILLDRGHLAAPEEAIVTGINPAGLRVRLPRLALNGFVKAERALGLERGQRGTLSVDEHGLTTTSGPWRVGSRVKVRPAGTDDLGRPELTLADPGATERD